MNHSNGQSDLSTSIAEALPFLRRYARALTGSQSSGDRYAAATLEAILQDRQNLESVGQPKIALFKTFSRIWTSSGAPVAGDADPDPSQAKAQMRLSGLTKNTREALLLHSIERFSNAEISQIMGVSVGEVAKLVAIARQEMFDSIRGRILVIEDEAIIAMDLVAIAEQMGHSVIGNARTRDGAVELARKDPPDLILADIQLADKSSGIDAVNHILKEIGDMPVVFITAFPERLLTGERPEPAFLITKPYTEDQVQSGISQAMFFTSTATMSVQE